MDMDRRKFFKLGAAAIAVAAISPSLLAGAPIESETGGWLFCNGAALPRAKYKALSEIMGLVYGGDETNLHLPDLRDRHFQYIIKVRADDDHMPLGSVIAWSGAELPK